MFAPRYDATKLKLNLKLANTRLQNLQKKMENQGILARKEIAKLLEKGKDELARIRVEQIIRDDYLIEAYEILEMYCSLLTTRFGLIDSVKFCDPGIEEAVRSLLWTAPRVQADVPEFKAISQYFAARFGKEFAEEAMQNQKNVNDRIMRKLSVHQPEPRIVDGYLRSIAQTYKVAWNPPEADLDAGAAELPGGLDALPSVPGAPGGHVADIPFPQATSSFPPGYPPKAAPGYPPVNSGYPPQQMYPPPQQQQQQQPYYPPQHEHVYAPEAPMAPRPSDQLPEYRTDPFPAPPADRRPPPSMPTVPDFPSAPPSSSSAGGLPDFDELTRRFQNLRKT